jgi:hypothetical protein
MSLAPRCRQCVDIYRYNAPMMFEKHWTKAINPFAAAYGEKVAFVDSFVVHPIACLQVKRDLLEFYIGKKTLGELNKYVVITSFRYR